MKTYRKLIEDKKWIQKATKNMRKDKPCTGEKFGSETCPPGSKRYNLAKTFRKMAKEEANTPEPPKKEADDPSIKSGKKKEAQLKKRVLMQKLRAVRSGVEGIVAHHEPEGEVLDEKKKKGLDGKACWDGYSLKGTKKKGGKTVDNCVKEEDKAFEYVKKQIAAKYGKSGYVSKDNPRKPQSSADRAKARAHQAKVDAENAAERKKDPSQGRYPKG